MPQQHKGSSTEFKLINSVSFKPSHLLRQDISLLSQLTHFSIKILNISDVVIEAELSLADSLLVVHLE
jgi:hypothetical protein